MFNNTLKYALVCGAFVCIVFVLARLLGSNPFIDINHLFIDLIILGLFIFFGMNDFKRYRNQGILHFWQGMTIGFFTYAIASFTFLVFIYLYFEFDERLLTEYVDQASRFLEERADQYEEQFGSEQLEDQRKTIQETKAGDLMLSATVKKLIAGLFVTPVISIILRKQPK